ncbi:MAG: sensor histidine kinase [Symbiobacteriia bacterium]
MPRSRLPAPWRRLPLFWRLFAGFMVTNLITLVAVGVSVSYLMRSRLLEAKETAVAARLRPLASTGIFHSVDPQAFVMAMKPLLEIDEAYWISADDWAQMQTVSQKMAAGTLYLGSQDVNRLRHGFLVSKWLVHNPFGVPPLGVAVPLPDGVLLVSASLSDVQNTIHNLRRLIFLSAIGGTALAAVLAFIISRQIAAPLGRLNLVARQFAEGNFSGRAAVDAEDEIGQVAHTFNLAAEGIQKTLEQQQVLVAQQQELDQLRRDFMANVSHEFRAPLASLRGYLELMLDGTVRTNEQPRVLRVMLDDSLRLGRLVDDLLDLAKLQAHRVSLRSERVDALDVIDRVLTAFESRAARKSVSLVADPPSSDPDISLPAVFGDEDRLVQVLTNLIDNALRFTPEHGSIEVSARIEGNSLRLAVSDTGRGIPPEELPHIWERFYKVDRARTPGEYAPEGGGTGLGLAIVKEIVTAMDGQVGCASEPGQGSTFWVQLPLAGSDAPGADNGDVTGSDGSEPTA